MAAHDEPTLTDLYQRSDTFRPQSGCVYVYGESSEDRSRHLRSWKGVVPGVRFVRVTAEENTAFSAEVDSLGARTVALRSLAQLNQIWVDSGARVVYVDVTGLSHHIWAPLLRSALKVVPEVRVVYVEPGQYTFSAAPTEGQIFDLSERITGVRPLPGFASLTMRRAEDVLFIPLLGFEGTRFAHMIEQVQPAVERIIPIVGVPGFRPEYPFYTYAGNRRALTETKAWQRVEFAAANCPFSLFYVLDRLAARYPRSVLTIAPIGTKPHAVGAVLFQITSKRHVELIYDHPVRKPGRTLESDRLLVYHVSAVAGGASP